MKNFFIILLVFIIAEVFISCSPTAATFGGWQYNKEKGLEVRAVGNPSPSQLKEIFRIKVQDDLAALLREGKISEETYFRGLDVLARMSDSKQELVLEVYTDGRVDYYTQSITDRVMQRLIRDW